VTKISYSEGDWFGVPLSEGGFATGVVARANRGGILVAYFFGPRSETPPSLTQVAQLTPGDAVLVGAVGDLGLLGGSWPLVGRLPNWKRDEWPIPVFRRYEELTGRSFRVYYDPDDPNKVLREEEVRQGERALGPRDGLMGAGFAERKLSSLLDASL
jgi:Immunity protein 26